MSGARPMRFTFLACADLRQIWEALAMPNDMWGGGVSENLARAQRFAEGFAHHCGLLADNPELGTDRSELRPGIRSSAFEKYVIFYRSRGETVEVVRVLRAARDKVPPA